MNSNSARLTIIQDQEYFDLHDAAFQNKLDSLTQTSESKFVVIYRASIGLKTAVSSSEGEAEEHTVEYRQTRCVPETIIDQAKYDGDFNANLCYSVAFNYRDDMLDFCANELKLPKEQLLCKSCGKQTGTHIVQVPMSAWHEDILGIHDAAAPLVCDNPECDAKEKRKLTDMMYQMSNFLNTVMQEQDIHRCLSCGKLDSDDVKLLRCSRCQNAYFCNRGCQKRAWKKHRKDCQFAEC